MTPPTSIPTKSYIIDMDGVIVLGGRLIAGAADLLRRLQERGNRFLTMTNNSFHTVDEMDRFPYRPHRVVTDLSDVSV